MAQVKTIARNTAPCFIENDASLADLISLEISEESSPKSDSDISILLSYNEISFEKQCLDKDKNGIKTSHQLSEGISNSSKTVNSNKMSLGALAKNHFENNRTVNEWRFASDFKNPSDVLCTDDRRVFISSEKGLDSNESFNLFGICLSIEDNLTNKEFTKTPENNADLENLSELVDSCHVLSFHSSGSVSLDSLAASHILNNSNNGSGSMLEKDFSDSFVFNFGNDDTVTFESLDCRDDILSNGKQENVNILSENDMLSILDELSSSHSAETKNHQSFEEALDGELGPDVDLSFCIKKNVKDKFSSNASSPESSDSGFDETELMSTQSNFSVSEKSILSTVTCPFVKQKLSSPKQSLLSRAISARPKIDNARFAKLKQIRSELYKKQVSSSATDYNQQKYFQIPEGIIDHSNECIMMSTFQKISEHSNF